jgi:predicted enzyme related to lactoylglutathione lyase
LVAFPGGYGLFRSKRKAFHDQFSGKRFDALLAQRRREGVTVDERTEKSEFGYFGWAMDPEGNRFELWEPPEVQAGS